MSLLEKELEIALVSLYERWKALGPPKNRFLQMVKRTRNERLYKGPVGTVRYLLNREPSAGFKDLIRWGRADLTVEALVLRPKWKPLFADSELQKAKTRIAAARSN
jgi:hypothetical protein